MSLPFSPAPGCRTPYLRMTSALASDRNGTVPPGLAELLGLFRGVDANRQYFYSAVMKIAEALLETP